MNIVSDVTFPAIISNIATVPNSPQARVYFTINSGYGLQAGQLMKWRDDRRRVDVILAGAEGFEDRIEFFANIYKVGTTRDKGQLVVLQYPTKEFEELYETLTGIYEYGSGLLLVSCFPGESEYADGEKRQGYNRKSRRR
jgi:hypothetical protein